jgi:hypothetical protein
VAERLSQDSLGTGQIQFCELFKAGVSLSCQAFQGLQIGFAGGGELFDSVVHFWFLG